VSPISLRHHELRLLAGQPLAYHKFIPAPECDTLIYRLQSPAPPPTDRAPKSAQLAYLRHPHKPIVAELQLERRIPIGTRHLARPLRDVVLVVYNKVAVRLQDCVVDVEAVRCRTPGSLLAICSYASDG